MYAPSRESYSDTRFYPLLGTASSSPYNTLVGVPSPGGMSKAISRYKAVLVAWRGWGNCAHNPDCCGGP